MTAINDLLAFQRQTEALSSIAERLSWDQETVMPRGAVERAAAQATGQYSSVVFGNSSTCPGGVSESAP